MEAGAVVVAAPLRVVLAEDSYLVREGIRLLIEEEHDLELVAICSDHPSLLAAVDEHLPDVVITDIRMPPTNSDEGIRAAQELRDRHPDVGVVVLSQYIEPGWALRLLDGGSVVDPQVVDALLRARIQRERSLLTRLTDRELEVLGRIAQGRNNAGIAGSLHLSQRAVEKHINAIFSKLDLPAGSCSCCSTAWRWSRSTGACSPSSGRARSSVSGPSWKVGCGPRGAPLTSGCGPDETAAAAAPRVARVRLEPYGEGSNSVDATSPTHEDGNSRVWYLQTAQSSGGAVHEQRVEYLAGSRFPPSHLHPAQDEHFEVEQGRMLFVVDGAERIVSAGETLDIPRGTAHRARNASRTESAVVRWETRPALRTTEFFTTAARLGDGMGLLDAALLAREFRDVFRPTGLSRWLVPVVAGVAGLGRRRLPGR